MDLHYHYSVPAPTTYYTQQSQPPPAPQRLPTTYDHCYGYDGHDDHYRRNDHDVHHTLSGSKQTSPSPFSHGHPTNDSSNSNNDSDATNESQATKTHKGKVFQCTGFGDCRMVFTRSEHLARHARKHTGEKPFQCVVEGCTRMFSRFDNMVQHTQTHTKGAHRESTEGIANKIAIESRRKSEAGLLGGSTLRRASSIKSLKSKRGSFSSGSGSESPQKGRHERMASMPMLNMTAVNSATGTKRSSTPSLASPVTPVTPMPSSPLSPIKQTRPRSKTLTKETGGGRIRKRQSSIRRRRGSLESSVPHAGGESWYASKLHHRPSLDFGLDQHRFFTGMNHRHDVNPLDSHAAAFHEQSMFSRLRHPLSPELSPHSDDIDSDDGGISSNHHHQHPPPADDYAEALQGVDPALDNCTLPPLRTSSFVPENKPRLPSISYGRLRSQSINSGSSGSSGNSHSNGSTDHLFTEPYPLLARHQTRRLSLVDLNAPIQQAQQATNHSLVQPHTGQTPGGVDVSEDEVKALEAFGQLWSQGRDVEMSSGERRSAATAAGMKGSRMKTEFVTDSPHVESTVVAGAPARENAPVPGPDFGRRPMIPAYGDDRTFYRAESSAMYID
ncbi:hypothetical protein BGZ98_009902 [Dissophora globulifera]|nr:hypothetical protein BGZ98_009902 [Dissophora globulifera]